MYWSIIILLQLNCDDGDCKSIMNTLNPGFGSNVALDSGSNTPKPVFTNPNLNLGSFPKESAAEDLDGSLNAYKEPEENVDLINNPPKN